MFFQVGLLTTVGLVGEERDSDRGIRARAARARAWATIEAAMEAARLRLRPILMTSLAFILGVLPLAISNGAGSASQHAIGTGVIGGMLTATFLAIFMIPMFFVVISKIRPRARIRRTHEHVRQRNGGTAAGSADDGSGKEGH